jgi:hypothetical protein
MEWNIGVGRAGPGGQSQSPAQCIHVTGKGSIGLEFLSSGHHHSTGDGDFEPVTKPDEGKSPHPLALFHALEEEAWPERGKL